MSGVFAGEEPNHVCLIDGSNMMHRAWAMARPRKRFRDGLEIGAAYLFSQMTAKLMRRMAAGKLPPTHAMIVFDPSRSALWRREIFPEYKAHRPPTDPVFAAQIPLMHRACDEAGLARCSAERHEADDVIAAYTRDAVDAGSRVTIVSGDKDMMQMISPSVIQYDAVNDRWFNAKAVEEKFGVPPCRIPDFLAIAGDKGDGVPGGKGLGPAAAKAMILEAGSLEAVLADPSLIARKGWREIVERSRAELEISLRLVLLDVEGSPRPLPGASMRFSNAMRTVSRMEVWRRDEMAEADAQPAL